MAEEKLCDNCDEMCGDPYCGKCQYCGGELEQDHVYPNPCIKCLLEMQKKETMEPLPFDL